MKHISLIEIAPFIVAVSTTAIAAGCASTPPAPAETTAPEIIVAKAHETTPAPAPCIDGDRDDVCDEDDRCPMQIGPEAAFGCPIDPCSGSPLLVLVQFKYDSSKIPDGTVGVQTMDPVLDAVAAAIAQDPSCRVCIVGHASEEGTTEYNEDLSRRRASAVQEYLTGRTLSEKRMPTAGLGERCQLIPVKSRSLNRRVEFRRLEKGQSCPMDCSG